MTTPDNPLMDDLEKISTFKAVDNAKAKEIILNDLEKYKIVTGIHQTEEESTSFIQHDDVFTASKPIISDKNPEGLTKIDEETSRNSTESDANEDDDEKVVIPEIILVNHKPIEANLNETKMDSYYKQYKQDKSQGKVSNRTISWDY